LYNEYYRTQNNYGYKFTRNGTLIEDAIHDLFVRLWTSRENLGTPVSVKNYLYKSLLNTLMRKIQSENKYTAIADTDYPSVFEVIYPGNATNGQFFRRFLYPVVEQTLNTNSYKAAVARQGADLFLTKIWWDK
jgi:DNA-directed RNA polymerase specialized sigma24 family protein